MALALKSTCNYLRETCNSLREPNAWAACDGLRAIAVLWVCAGHATFYGTHESLAGEWGLLMPFSKDVAVDLFLVLSGLLIGSAMQREMKKGLGQMSWTIFYVRRLFRIVPAYLSACLLEWLFLAVANVPYADIDRESCKTLWRNFLFINNFFVPEATCMGQSWSIAVEMQLYLVTPPLFYLSQKLNKVWAAPWIHVLCASAWFTCCMLRLLHVIALGDSMANFDPALYYFTQYRYAPYIAGVSVGVALTNSLAKDASTTSLPRQDSRLVAVLKYVATACSYATFLLAWFNGGDFKSILQGEKVRQLVPNPMIFVLISSLLRPVLGVALAWSLASCIKGQATRLNAFLSARCWCPVAALSYSMYIMEGIGQRSVSNPFLVATENLADMSIPLRCLRGYGAIAVYIAAAMLLAIFNFTLVERPGMLLGKHVVSWLKIRSANSEVAKSKERDLEIGEAPLSAVPSTVCTSAPVAPEVSPQQLQSAESNVK